MNASRVVEWWRNFGIRTTKVWRRRRKKWKQLYTLDIDHIVVNSWARNSKNGFGTWYSMKHMPFEFSNTDAHSHKYTHTRFRFVDIWRRAVAKTRSLQPSNGYVVVCAYFLFVHISHEPKSHANWVFGCVLYTSPLDIAIGFCIYTLSNATVNRIIPIDCMELLVNAFSNRYGYIYHRLHYARCTRIFFLFLFCFRTFSQSHWSTRLERQMTIEMNFGVTWPNQNLWILSRILINIRW